MGMLDGRVAVITGSGRGIGRAAALMMAREGAAMAVSDLDEAPARHLLFGLAAFRLRNGPYFARRRRN